MATLEELQQQQFAQTIIPGLQEMVQPQNIPTGAQLAPGFTAPQTQAANILQQGLGSTIDYFIDYFGMKPEETTTEQ